MPFSAEDVEDLDADARGWVLDHAERRLAGHERATSAQEGRAVVALTTSVALAALAGLIAATALSFHHDSSVELIASLLAMTGFSTSSAFFLGSLRSAAFTSSGAQPSQAAEAGDGRYSVERLQKARIFELEACVADNEAMMEVRRRLGNWGLWTLMATPIFALLCGWLGA